LFDPEVVEMAATKGRKKRNGSTCRSSRSLKSLLQRCSGQPPQMLTNYKKSLMFGRRNGKLKADFSYVNG
jgi:hypothetical protein